MKKILFLLGFSVLSVFHGFSSTKEQNNDFDFRKAFNTMKTTKFYCIFDTIKPKFFPKKQIKDFVAHAKKNNLYETSSYYHNTQLSEKNIFVNPEELKKEIDELHELEKIKVIKQYFNKTIKKQCAKILQIEKNALIEKIHSMGDVVKDIYIEKCIKDYDEKAKKIFYEDNEIPKQITAIEHIFLKIIDIFIEDYTKGIAKKLHILGDPDILSCEKINQCILFHPLLKVFFINTSVCEIDPEFRCCYISETIRKINRKIQKILSPREYRYLMDFLITNGVEIFRDIASTLFHKIFKAGEDIAKTIDADMYISDIEVFKTHFLFTFVASKIPSIILFFQNPEKNCFPYEIQSLFLYFNIPPLFRTKDKMDYFNNGCEDYSLWKSWVANVVDSCLQIDYVDSDFYKTHFFEKRNNIFRMEYRCYQLLHFFYLQNVNEDTEDTASDIFSDSPKNPKNPKKDFMTIYNTADIRFIIYSFLVPEHIMDFIDGFYSYNELIFGTYHNILYSYDNDGILKDFYKEKLLPKIIIVHSLLPQERQEKSLPVIPDKDLSF